MTAIVVAGAVLALVITVVFVVVDNAAYDRSRAVKRADERSEKHNRYLDLVIRLIGLATMTVGGFFIVFFYFLIKYGGFPASIHLTCAFWAIIFLIGLVVYVGNVLASRIRTGGREEKHDD